MIVAFGFCTRDQELALRNARWWNELGGCKGHELLVCYDPRCDPGVVESIRVEMEKGFDRIWRINGVGEMDGWAQGANYFFKLCCTWLQAKPEWPSFLWMEPDAIPISPGWLDALEAEYKRGGKPFMGDRVEVKVEGKEVPLHMSGVGIYQNPIYMLAGEAYRAHDEPWDMAARNQIVPNAYFTELIEHAWKHPTFHDASELGTQIAGATVVFHSSKDGSLIDLLQQKRRGKPQTEASISEVPIPKEAAAAVSPSPLPISQSLTPYTLTNPVCDIFIRTFAQDYDWLKYCLQSIWQFTSGFRKVWIVSPSRAPDWFHKPLTDGVEWKVMNDESPDGYLAQQITKLYADVITDYQPDYILHVDSDTLFARPVTPAMFFEEGKPTWYYTPYESIQTPWQPVTEKFLRQPMPYEFMRRMPFLIPRWLYPKMREYCHRTHGVIISEYIRTQPPRAFSEFNAIGAYAFRNHGGQFKWINTLDSLPEHFCRQFRSWDGLTAQYKAEIETILGGTGEKDLKDAPPVSSQIKKLRTGVWVLEGDQISGWVEEEGRLDHDQNLLPRILPLIEPGDTVIDAGAHIGDHTVAYARKAGPRGMVHAFEPNPVAFECLAHNLEEYESVYVHPVALGDTKSVVPLSGNNGQPSGVYVGEHMKLKDVRMQKLDAFKLGPDFIKIDIEGCELKMLQGAEKTIDMYKPKMVIEINRPALERQGATPDQIFGWLTRHLYGWRIIEENALRNDPQYNIIALPAVDRPGSAQVKAETSDPERIGVSASTSTPSPQVLLSNLETIKHHVSILKGIVETNSKNKAKVMQQLVYAGLRKPNPYKKAERKRKRALKEHSA